jgi:hypothetical protein
MGGFDLLLRCKGLHTLLREGLRREGDICGPRSCTYRAPRRRIRKCTAIPPRLLESRIVDFARILIIRYEGPLGHSPASVTDNSDVTAVLQGDGDMHNAMPIGAPLLARDVVPTDSRIL